ncbi:MAG TPA: YqaA family protein, partial [Vicinamibacteria bacterium]|nr:YqaA family protein [Vicinamibacteria bacterium]
MTDTSPLSGAAAGSIAVPAPRVVPWWNLPRRLYDWVLHFAHSPHSERALFGLSFAESSFFPIPPDVLLMPLVLGRPARWLRLATICTAASVLGGIVGFAIGYGLWHEIGDFVFGLHLPSLTQENFDKVAKYYEEYNFWIVFTAGLTPIPYKVITISAGIFALSDQVTSPAAFFAMFVFASALGRASRFYAVSWLCQR